MKLACTLLASAWGTRHYTQEEIEKYGHVDFGTFKEIYQEIDPALGGQLITNYRFLKADCYVSGHCKNAAKKRNILHPVNPWDVEGSEVKPDSVAGESWDYAEGADIIIEGRTIILDRDVTAGVILIQNG